MSLLLHAATLCTAPLVPVRSKRCYLPLTGSRPTGVLTCARLDDDGARRIGEQAHELAHTHLCDAARRCYLYELLRRYGKAMTYQPSLADRPGARLVTRLEEVIFFNPKGTGTAPSRKQTGKGQRRAGRANPRG